MANRILTPRALVAATIAHLENDLVIANLVHTDYSKEFVAKGDTIDVKRPQRFLGQRNNLDISNYREELVNGKYSITMDQTVTIPFDISAKDLTLSIKSGHIKSEYIDPAVATMKEAIESELAKNYWRFGHFYGTPGTTPSSFKELATPGAILTDGAIPKMGRMAIHNTETSVELADGLKGVYVQDKARTAYEEARIGRYGGFDNYESVHIPAHTVGDYGGTLLVAGANQNVNYRDVADQFFSELAIDGGTASTTGFLKRGDVITIDGVFAINPQTRQSTGRLATFTLYEDADTDGSGATTLKVFPPIIPPVANPTTDQDITNTAFATVSAAPADNAPITVKTGAANSTHRQSLLMPKKALTLVTRPLMVKAHGSFQTETVMGNKVTVTCSKGGNFNDLSASWRFDMLFGTTSMNPDYGLRLTA